MSKIIPNTFQTPNALVDQVMAHLTDSELRVMLYAVRHIYGWQDRAAHNVGEISLTMFEHGFTVTHDDGETTQYGGCGLGRGAIIRALEKLVTFKLLIKAGKPTTRGQAWKIGTTPDFEALEARTLEAAKTNRQRTQKATAKRTGTSDVPVTSDVPEGVTSDVLNQSQLQSHTLVSTKDVETRVAPLKKPRKTPPHDAHYHALIEAFGYTHDSIPKTLQGTYGMAAAQIYKCGVALEDVPRLHSYVKRLADEQHWTSFTVMALVNRVPDFLRDKQNGQSADHHKIDGFRIIT